MRKKADSNFVIHGLVLLFVYLFIFISAITGTPAISSETEKINNSLTGSINAAAATEPNVPSSNVTKFIANCDEINVVWTMGNGSSRILIMKEGSPVTALPTDNSDYNANPVFGQGDHLGNGNYAVYKGQGNSTIIDGLKTGTIYHFAIFEFNGSGSNTNYLTSLYPSVNLPVADEINLNASTNHITCNGDNDGRISLNILGGSSPFQYNWSHNKSTATISQLNPGNYSVTVTDSVGCIKNSTFTINEPDQITGSLTGTDLKCHGDKSGQIIFTPIGGTLPYAYSWSNNGITKDLFNLAGGNFNVTLTDKNGCEFKQSVQISEPAQLEVSADVNNISCHGESDGNITITPSGGIPAYSLIWGNGSISPSISQLAQGNYSLQITDLNNCLLDSQFEIKEPDVLEVQFNIEDETCEGEFNGSIATNVSGGTQPYSYYWLHGSSSQNQNHLATGSYILSIQDENGCLLMDSAYLKLQNDPAKCDLDLTIYDIFTPNGDGQNENWVIEGLFNYPDNSIEIFNRWGKMVYQESGYQNNWKGTDQSGKELAAGTYYYILRVYGSSEVNFSGPVTFLR